MKEKILILGASSYIGENLLFFLKKEKYKVFCTYNKNYKTIFKYFTSIKLDSALTFSILKSCSKRLIRYFFEGGST